MRLLLASLVLVGVAHATTNFTNDLTSPDLTARYPSRVYPDYLRDIVDKTETFRIYSNVEFQSYCARLINSKRKLHENTPNLVIGQNFTDYTLDRAYQILADIEKSRDINKGRYPYGESFFWFYDPARFRSEEEAVNTWYDEAKLYDYNSPRFSPKTGGFTQLVWRSSEKIACAKIEYEYKSNLQRRTLFVCNFWPAGNVNGEFAYNVMPTSRQNSGNRPPPDDVRPRPTRPPRPPPRPTRPNDDYPPRPTRPNDDYPSRPNRPNDDYPSRPNRPTYPDDDYPSRPNRPEYPGDRPTRPSRRPTRPRPPQPDYDYEDYDPPRQPPRRPNRPNRPYPDYDKNSNTGTHIESSDSPSKPRPDLDSNDLAPKAESAIDSPVTIDSSVMEPADATATVLEERQRRPYRPHHGHPHHGYRQPYYPPHYPPHHPPYYPHRAPYYPYYAFRSAGEGHPVAVPAEGTFVLAPAPAVQGTIVRGSSQIHQNVHIPTVSGMESVVPSTVELEPQTVVAPVALPTVPASEITAEQPKSVVNTVPVVLGSQPEPQK